MPQLSLHLFDHPCIEMHGNPIQFDRKKALALLIFLACEPKPHSREKLTHLFWAGYPQKAARHNLTNTLSSLRKALGGKWLMVNGSSIQLPANEQIWVDVQEFSSLRASRRNHGHPTEELCSECLPALEQATALYSADFLSGFTVRDAAEFEGWQRFVTDSLRSDMRNSLRTLAEWHARLGENEAARRYAKRLLTLNPLDEQAYRHLAEIHLQAGERFRAKAELADCIRILEAEGLQPSQETIDLAQRIEKTQPAELAKSLGLDQAKDLIDADTSASTESAGRVDSDTKAASDRAQPSTHHNLPAPIRPFIGRETELADLSRLLADPAIRLIAIVGPGGMGKTRLALAAGGMQTDSTHYQTPAPADQEGSTAEPLFPDGVFFGALAPVPTTDQISVVIAEAVGYSMQIGKQTRTPKQQIFDYLRHKQMLLILDNFEHLSDGGAFVRDILHNAPHVQILITSRERLHLPGEQIYVLQGLEIPDSDTLENAAESTAVQLFLQSARLVRSDFTLRTEELSDLARICTMVGGMPLALNLAAGWVDVLPLAEIAEEIQHSLDFLETDSHNMPARQRSMRAVFDNAWLRLNQTERNVLAQLSVFRGGFDRQAASDVTGATIRTLAALVAKSLLQVSADMSRYDVHELVRQFAAEQLGPDAKTGKKAVERTHARVFLAWVEKAEPKLHGPDQGAWLQRLENEQDNLRAALQRMIESDEASTAAQLGSALWHFWYLRSHHLEGIEWLQQVLTLETSSEERAKVLYGLGMLARRTADDEAVRACMNEALDLFRCIEDEYQTASSLRVLGFVDYRVGKMADAEQKLQEALTIFSELSHQDGIAVTLTDLSYVRMAEQNLATAQSLIEQSLAIRRKLDNWNGMANNLDGLAYIFMYQGAYDRAATVLEESRQIYEALGNPQAAAMASSNAGINAYLQGENSKADHLFRQAHPHMQVSGNRENIAKSHIHLALTNHQLERDEEACNHIRQALHFSRGSELSYVDLCLASVGLIALAKGHVACGLKAAAKTSRMESMEVLFPLVKEYLNFAVASARTQMDEHEFAAAWHAGETMTVEEILAEAMDCFAPS